MMTPVGANVSLSCSRKYLSKEYDNCTGMIGRENGEDGVTCFQETFRRKEIRECLFNNTNTGDEVENFLMASECVKKKMKEFKVKYLSWPSVLFQRLLINIFMFAP